MTKIAVIPVMENPRIVEIDGNDILRELQGIVGGYIEHFTVLYGDKPALIINENGIAECPPNRAVYATAKMAEKGYLSQIDGSIVKWGELYAILFGDIAAVSFDEDGYVRDITQEEFDRVYDMFSGIGSQLSGIVEARYTAANHRKPTSEEGKAND